MLKKIYDYIFSNDALAEEMIKSIETENDYSTMDDSKLFIQDVKNLDIEIPTFNINPNKQTILIIDDYPGITNTPNIIINTYDDLNINDYNILKFYGIHAGKILLSWLEQNKDVKIDMAIIDMLINGIDGVDILYKIQSTNPDVRYVFYTGVYLDGGEYKYNKARAKYNKFIKGEFLDNIILKSQNFELEIAPAMYEFIKG